MTADGRDELLAALLAELEDRARQGNRIEIESVARAHPQIADELRALWAVSAVADALASQPGRERPTGTGAAAGEAPEDPSNSARARPAESREFSDYELLEILGEGGMGVVYRARHRQLGRIVALKMIRPDRFVTDVDRKRFFAEARSAALLDHPQIVPVYEVGEHQGQPFYSMKLVAGSTLSQRLAAGPLTARETVDLLLPVCRAIAYAHERGIIHRDLKPSNVLIDHEQNALVADFGLAKRIEVSQTPLAAEEADGHSPGGRDDLTRTGAIMGTPAYMSPEQAAGGRGQVGPASDVYSLGAILYQCLTGRPPFQAASPFDVLLMVLEQDVVLPRVVNPVVDAELELIALKCLQKPPELRYLTAAALADDLARWLANEPISARSTNVGQLVSRLMRETHHAGVLQNWGILWMWHSLVLLTLCVATNILQWQRVETRGVYLALWVVGLGAWAAAFWTLRRRGGPITFVERQIAHVWGASMAASSLLFALETILGMPVLELSPVLPLIAASVFLVKAGMLSGAFYLPGVALSATALAMAWIRKSGLPDFGLTLYGVVSAASFFLPGLKYHRQRSHRRTGVA